MKTISLSILLILLVATTVTAEDFTLDFTWGDIPLRLGSSLEI